MTKSTVYSEHRFVDKTPLTRASVAIAGSRVTLHTPPSWNVRSVCIVHLVVMKMERAHAGLDFDEGEYDEKFELITEPISDAELARRCIHRFDAALAIGDPGLVADAKQLWDLLDDISTADDACKDDDAEFRKRAYALAEKRLLFFTSDGQSLRRTTRDERLKRGLGL